MSDTSQHHRHWDTFDYDECEGARMDALHALVATAPYDVEAAAPVVEELVDMARSKGWGEEDSWICSVGGQAPEQDSDEEAAQREQHGEDPDSEYTECLDRSVRLILVGASTADFVSATPGMYRRHFDVSRRRSKNIVHRRRSTGHDQRPCRG